MLFEMAKSMWDLKALEFMIPFPSVPEKAMHAEEAGGTLAQDGRWAPAHLCGFCAPLKGASFCQACWEWNSFFLFFIKLFIYFWLCWVFVSVRGLSPVAASGGHSSSRCAGLSPSRPLLLRSTGSRRAGSVVVAHGLSCSVACGIFPDQGSNPCRLHWQADSQPLHHQGSLRMKFLMRDKGQTG